MSLGLFIFRRDLRIHDNTGLMDATRENEKVVVAFIFDPRQTRDNSYFSRRAFIFMMKSLHELNEALQNNLFLFCGEAEQVIEEILMKKEIDSVHINRDYTPFSINRDNGIRRSCRSKGVNLAEHPDCLLTEPEQVLKKDGSAYKVFGPFLRKAKTIAVRKPATAKIENIYKKKPADFNGIAQKDMPAECTGKETFAGGRKEAEQILSGLEAFSEYNEKRNYPALDATTHLSAHLKFGTCSVREAYHRIQEILGQTHPLTDQLYWRDFFTHLAYHFPSVFGREFKEKYRSLKWKTDPAAFLRWCDGQTGFPIVDAGMRELNQTGFMHNRVRMITASFLVKDLHIDWRLGEMYFAKKLTDYDPCINNGNWQWNASTGCDATPYVRILNPWRQQQRFDPDAEYIKKWVPELETLAPREIHQLHKNMPGKGIVYPKQMVSHEAEAHLAKAVLSQSR